MTIESSISFFILIVVFAITPGPGVFALLARSLSNGYKSCISLAVGMTLGDISYLVASSLGLGIIASNWSEFFIIMRFAGGGYLLYLAYNMWISPISSVNTTDFSKSHHLSGFIQGASISFSNPKVILFYIAFLPTFIDITTLQTLDIVVISILTFFALILGLVAVAFFADKLSGYLNSQSGQQKLMRFASLLMAFAGGYLLIDVLEFVVDYF